MQEAEVSRPVKWHKNWKPVVSSGMALSGLLLLGHNHFDSIVTADNVAIGMIAAGGVSALLTSGHPVVERYKKRKRDQSKFTFEVINDASLFSAEQDSLEQAVPIKDLNLWPEDIQKKLLEYRKHDAKRIRSDIASRKAAMTAALSDPGAAHTTEREALSALAPRAFVLDYIDPPRKKSKDRRSRAELLGEEVSMLLACASPHDVVLVNLTSPGGSVVEYGLAASHLLRLKKAGIRSIVTVDKVAASGGFMMACCADEIVAAPFAYLGSIGVVAELPNFHRVLNKNEVDYFMFTAGKFKRTVSLFNEVTTEGRDKFQGELEEIHKAFKQHVSEQRGSVIDVEKVATGEAWLALQCKEYGLVDRLGTSWDIVKEMADNGYDVVKVERGSKRRIELFNSLYETSSGFATSIVSGFVDAVREGAGKFAPMAAAGGAADPGAGRGVHEVHALRSDSSIIDNAKL